VSKIFHFSSEIIFGQLLQTFGDFLLVTLLPTLLAFIGIARIALFFVENNTFAFVLIWTKDKTKIWQQGTIDCRKCYLPLR